MLKTHNNCDKNTKQNTFFMRNELVVNALDDLRIMHVFSFLFKRNQKWTTSVRYYKYNDNQHDYSTRSKNEFFFYSVWNEIQISQKSFNLINQFYFLLYCTALKIEKTKHFRMLSENNASN